MASLEIPEGLNAEDREWLAEVRDALGARTPEERMGFTRGFVPTVQEIDERVRMVLDGIESILQGKPGFRDWYSAVLLAQRECPSTEGAVSEERHEPPRRRERSDLRAKTIAAVSLALKLVLVFLTASGLGAGIGPYPQAYFAPMSEYYPHAYFWPVFLLVTLAGIVVIAMPKLGTPLRYRIAQSFVAFVVGLIALWFLFWNTRYLDLVRTVLGPRLTPLPLVIGALLSAYVVYRSMKATRGFTTVMKKREVTLRIWQFIGATFVIAGVLAYFGARLPDLINQSSTTPRSDAMLPELLGVGVPAFVYWNMMLFLPKVILNAIETKVSDDQIAKVWKRPSKGT